MAARKKIITDSTTVQAQTLPGGMPPVPQQTTIVTTADTLQEYVSGGQTQWINQGIHVEPWNFDDLTSDFGDQIYERMLYDPFVKSMHTIYKKSILAEGFTIPAAPLDPMDKWRMDKAAALASHKASQTAKEKAIAGAKPDPLHVDDPANPAPAPMVPEDQPKIPDKPKPQTMQDQIAEECGELLKRLEPPFPDVLDNMLDAAAMGNKVAELVWEYVRGGKFAGKLMLKSIKVKPRRTVAFVVDRYLNILGILNVKPGLVMPALTGQVFTPIKEGEKDVILPREKFFIFTHAPKDSDPRGSSYLRSAYTAWWGKMQLYPEYLRYLSQFGSPSLIGYTAPGASSVQTTGGTISAQQNMVNTLSTFRGGTAMSFPYGSDVKTLLEGVAGRSFIDDFAYFNNEMAVGILTMNPNGAREGIGTAKVHQDTMSMLIKSAKSAVEHAVVRDLFTPYVLYNHGEGARDMIPGFSLGGGNQPDMAAELASAAQAGYSVTPSMFLSLDKHFGFTGRDPDEIATLQKRLTAGSDPTPAPSDAPPRPGGGFPPKAGGGPPGQDNTTK